MHITFLYFIINFSSLIKHLNEATSNQTGCLISQKEWLHSDSQVYFSWGVQNSHERDRQARRCLRAHSLTNHHFRRINRQEPAQAQQILLGFCQQSELFLRVKGLAEWQANSPQKIIHQQNGSLPPRTQRHFQRHHIHWRSLGAMLQSGNKPSLGGAVDGYTQTTENWRKSEHPSRLHLSLRWAWYFARFLDAFPGCTRQ